ncbi:MAG: hypothetical protein D6706_14775, partial [Chloroflexi bacterium]
MGYNQNTFDLFNLFNKAKQLKYIERKRDSLDASDLAFDKFIILLEGGKNLTLDDILEFQDKYFKNKEHLIQVFLDENIDNNWRIKII